MFCRPNRESEFGSFFLGRGKQKIARIRVKGLHFDHTVLVEILVGEMVWKGSKLSSKDQAASGWQAGRLKDKLGGHFSTL